MWNSKTSALMREQMENKECLMASHITSITDIESLRQVAKSFVSISSTDNQRLIIVSFN